MIDDILGPAICACGLHQYHDFPADQRHIAHITDNQAREIIWDIAECNFRFEFLSLDRRASRLSCPDACRKCFAGGMLMGMPIGLSKQGLASISSEERHPYVVRIAWLMRDWFPCPSAIITEAHDRPNWMAEDRHALEIAVAAHYTQTFYDFFGCAAVVPMRLEHEFGT